MADRAQVWLDPAYTRVADRCVGLLAARRGRAVTRVEAIRIALDDLAAKLEPEETTDA